MNTAAVATETPSFRQLNQDRVFGCKGQRLHLHLGKHLLKKQRDYICPRCHKPVQDITDTPVGRAFFDFVRPDLAREL